MKIVTSYRLPDKLVKIISNNLNLLTLKILYSGSTATISLINRIALGIGDIGQKEPPSNDDAYCRFL